MVVHEIEQKFGILAHLLPRFRSNGGMPPFHHLRFLRTEHFEDAYYDSHNQLSRHGLWVRRRAARWEAKQRTSGDFTRTTFRETTDVAEIQALVAAHLQRGGGGGGAVVVTGPEANFGLDVISRFTTTRELFRADERFLVALDATDFGHCVGEVEVLAEDARRAHAEIDAFMQRYAWFFLREKQPKGKLTAYFEKFGYPRD